MPGGTLDGQRSGLNVKDGPVLLQLLLSRLRRAEEGKPGTERSAGGSFEVFEEHL